MGWLDSEVVTLALCWRLERRDGIAIGLTSHDADLTVGGFTYAAAPGMTPSAVSRAAGLDADTMTAAGPLTADALSEADLLAGRWDGARVVLLAADWTGEGAPVPLGSGTIGAVTLNAGGFSAELQGVAAALAAPIAEETSAECRAELGDARCRVAMAGRRRFARVVSAGGAALVVDTPEPTPNAYGAGRLRWFGGANSGLTGAVAASDGAGVTLRAAPAFAPEPGALVELIEGCDHLFATCCARFGNAANFRGEPFLPGTDLLTRYPGG